MITAAHWAIMHFKLYLIHAAFVVVGPVKAELMAFKSKSLPNRIVAM